MSETKLAPHVSAQPTDLENDSAIPGAREIRQLTELELALAGGGDGTYEWP